MKTFAHLDSVGPEQLRALVQEPPSSPRSAEETGLGSWFLHDLMLKFLHVHSLETSHEIADAIKLSIQIVEGLLGDLKKQALIQIPGSRDRMVLRHGLTSEGKQRASEALAQSAYVGPAPVSLDAFRDQVERQSITHEQIDANALESAVSHVPMKSLEVVVNGQPVFTQKASADGQTAQLSQEVELTDSSWVAVRVRGDAHRMVPNDKTLYAHTSPVYCYRADRPIHFRDDAQYFIEKIDVLLENLERNGLFKDAAQKQEVVDLFHKGQNVYRKIVKEATR